MERYIDYFLPSIGRKNIVFKCGRERVYEAEHIIIHCIRRNHLGSDLRGRRSHIVAVQEELTWIEDWHDIKTTFIAPLINSPIDIQIFDGTHENNRLI